MDMLNIQGCDICGEDHFTEECPIFFVDNCSTSETSRARITLPSNVKLLEQDGELPKVIAKHLIPAKAKLGPFEAKKVSCESSTSDSFILKIFSKSEKPVMLETIDEYQCNWLYFIQVARNVDELNCIAVQIGVDIYYVTIKDIEPNIELRVWYAPHYAKKLGRNTTPDGVITSLMGRKHSEDLSVSCDEQSSTQVMSPQGQLDSSQIEDKEDKVTNVGHFNNPIDMQNLSTSLSKSSVEENQTNEIVEENDSSAWVVKAEPREDTSSWQTVLPSQQTVPSKPTHSLTEGQIPESTKQVLSELNNPRQLRVCHPMNTSGPCKCRRCGMVCDDVYKLAVHVKQHILKETEQQKRLRRSQQKPNKPGSIDKQELKQIIQTTEKRKLPEGIKEETKKVKLSNSPNNYTSHGKTTETVNTRRSSRIPSGKVKIKTASALLGSNEENHPGNVIHKTISINTTEKHVDKLEVETVNTEQNNKMKDKVRKLDPLVKAFLKRSKKKQLNSNINKNLKKIEQTCVSRGEGQSYSAHSQTEKWTKVHEESPIKVEPNSGKVNLNDSTNRNATAVNDTTNEEINEEKTQLVYICEVCHRAFSSDAILSRHEAIHNGIFNCEECGERFDDKSMLDQHECSVTRTEAIMYGCNICSRLFENKQYLEKHKEGHKTLYNCDECGRKFMYLSAYTSHQCATKQQQHTTDHKQEQYYCEFCGASFKTANYLLAHMSNHTEEFVCTKCGVHYARKETWKQHVAKCNPDALQKLGQSIFRCNKCPKIFTRKVALLNHEKIHLKTFECDVCKVSFATSFSLARHRCQGEPPDRYQCKECGRTFKKRIFLERHKPFHTGEFTCVICSKRYERKEALTKHMLECRANVQVAATGHIVCTVCKQQFNDAKDYRTHYMEHTHPFGCEKCDLRFMRRINLDKHSCQDYKGKTFPCTKCSKVFKNPKYLERHMDVHKGGSFKCDRCGNIFRRLQMWKIHMCVDDMGNRVLIHRTKDGTVQTLKTVSTVCTICGKSYHNVSNLNKHMKRHFPKTEKCDKCGMMFHEPAGLKAHKENMHGSQGAKWACEYCGKKMKCRNSLYTHRKTFHEVSSVVFQCSKCYRQFKSKSYLLRHVETHKTFRPLFCTECPKNFKTEDQLKKHKQWHANGDSYDCDFCESHFSTESEVKRHTRKQHAGMLFCCDYCNIFCAQKDAMEKHLLKCHIEEKEWQIDTDTYINSLIKFIQEYADKQVAEVNNLSFNNKRKMTETSSYSVTQHPTNNVQPNIDLDGSQGQVLIAEVQLPEGASTPGKQTILIQTADNSFSALPPNSDLSQQVLEALQQISHPAVTKVEHSSPNVITVDGSHSDELANVVNEQGYIIIPTDDNPHTDIEHVVDEPSIHNHIQAENITITDDHGSTRIITMEELVTM